MTSAKFSGFLTPSLPLVSTKSTQPPLLSSEIGQPPPSPSLLTSLVNGPLDTASDAECKNDVQHDVYIGGPASAVAAALHAKSGQSTDRILYCHDGRREASNWKGSASYFHIRDSVPVYYWPDNHGAYTLYATLKHFYQKNFSYARYAYFVCLGLGAYAYNICSMSIRIIQNSWEAEAVT